MTHPEEWFLNMLPNGAKIAPLYSFSNQQPISWANNKNSSYYFMNIYYNSGIVYLLFPIILTTP